MGSCVFLPKKIPQKIGRKLSDTEGQFGYTVFSVAPIESHLLSPNSMWLVTSRHDTTRYLAHAFLAQEKS